MKTEIITKTEEIDYAAALLRSGGLAAVPTETVYGLAANGLDAAAVEQLYAVKGRPAVKPLSLMVPGAAALDELCRDVPAGAYALAEAYWPGPLTLVLKADTDKAPSIVRAGGDTVGLRCPDHPLTLELLRRCGVPLAAPSANPSGMPPPKTAPEVFAYFDGEIGCVIDGGTCENGVASTILDLSETPYRVLRAGVLPEAALWETLKQNLTVAGLTGGSGAGKTTALRVLEAMGARVLDADAVYHELTETSAPLREELTARFGDIYDGGGKLNRRRLADVVFRDEAALQDLNAVTHKYVLAELDRRLGEHARCGGTLAAIDAIALLEAGLDKQCAFTVAVTAPVEHRVRRLTARDGISEEAARRRIAAQKDDAYFEARCDYVLRNEGDRAIFEQQCQHFFTEVLGENGRRRKEGR